MLKAHVPVEWWQNQKFELQGGFRRNSLEFLDEFLRIPWGIPSSPYFGNSYEMKLRISLGLWRGFCTMHSDLKFVLHFNELNTSRTTRCSTRVADGSTLPTLKTCPEKFDCTAWPDASILSNVKRSAQNSARQHNTKLTKNVQNISCKNLLSCNCSRLSTRESQFPGLVDQQAQKVRKNRADSSRYAE
jgi:hypothetical protein